MIRSYFISLYTSSVSNNLTVDVPWPSSLRPKNFHSLTCLLEETEIRKTLFDQMAKKSLGPETKHNVIKIIQDIFVSRFIPKFLNETFIVLIPKSKNIESIKQLRSISLCITIYKTLLKIIVNRLRPHLENLISPL